ncbi:hypothetical protein PIROE2DRAFT_57173 [Piromyces sp. E2]|nr:hypothetical protein PIROE2DRAFT_57173 [Piromyces sp. E2]|eukprot:OUM69927.1 hypothetical protein PIROE2DRAFT_57173 [Piromyces sp. E2]
MGINNEISEEKKMKVAKVIEYFVSYECQKEIILEEGYQTTLSEIYDDKSTCESYVQCQDFKYIQPILRPIHATEDYSQYSQKYRNFLLKYLYENENLRECLQNIEYLTKIFYEENDTFMNRLFMSMIIFAIVFMLSCYCLAFTKKHKHKFKLLNRFYWFLYMLGQMILMCYGIAGMGETTDFKCQIRSIIFSVGFTLGNTILLVRMLINFPESERRFVRFCERNFGKTILFSLSIDAILNVIALIDPYGVEVIVDGNIMYNKCLLTSTIGLFAIGLIFLYKLLILFAMAILVFIEWNIKEFMHDVRYATATLFISFIIYLIFGMVQNMKIGGYRERFFIPAMITYIYGMSCFCSYFVARFFSNYDENTEEAIIKKAVIQEKPLPTSYEKYSSSMSLNQSHGNLPQKKLSVADRLIGLHNYGDEIKKSYDVLKTSSNNSSSTNLSATRVNLRKNSRSFTNINDSVSFNNRRASQATQIMAIPENKIADSYAFASSSNSNPTDSMGQDSSNSDENVNTSKIKSNENFANLSATRVNRINSTPNKKFLGYGMANKRSYENFPNVGLRKGSNNVSYTNIHPIVGSSYTNLPISRKESVNNHNASSSSISLEKPPALKSSEHIVIIPNCITEKEEKASSSQQSNVNNANNDIHGNEDTKK